MIQLFEIHICGEEGNRKNIPLTKVEYFRDLTELKDMIKKQSSILNCPVHPTYRTIPDSIYHMDKIALSNKGVDDALQAGILTIIEPLMPRPGTIKKKMSENGLFYIIDKSNGEYHLPGYIPGDIALLSEPYNKQIFRDGRAWKKPAQMACNLCRGVATLSSYDIITLEESAEHGSLFERVGFNSIIDFITYWDKQYAAYQYHTKPVVWVYKFTVTDILTFNTNN